MTLKELEYFLALCKNPHMSQIANELSISQSALSLAIKSLEHKVDEKLFNRIGKKLILNSRGRYFRDKTEPYFLSLKDAVINFKKQRISGELKILSSKTYSTYKLPQLSYEFMKIHKDTSITKSTKNSKEIVSDIRNGLADIGFIEIDTDDLHVKKEFIGDDELIIVSSDECLSNKEVFIDKLSQKNWLLREEGSGTREVFLNTLGEYKNELNIFMEVKEFVELKNLLINNKDTLSALSKNALQKELKTGELFEIKLKNFKFYREFYMIYHKDKYKNKLFKEFTDFIKQGII